MVIMSAMRGSCAVLALLLVVSAGGIAIYAERDTLTGKAYSITYSVSSSPERPVNVAYGKSKGRYLGSREIEEHKENSARGNWQTEVVVASSQTAKVSAAPAPGATATCRILLDSSRILATSTSPAPGEPAVCTADLSGL